MYIQQISKDRWSSCSALSQAPCATWKWLRDGQTSLLSSFSYFSVLAPELLREFLVHVCMDGWTGGRWMVGKWMDGGWMNGR
jgi:hypothetical protein